MLGMGCSINFNDCWKIAKRPFMIMVGVLCQFLIMPCIALALGKIFSATISEYQALIILLMGCSPGGSLSNIMSIWIDGDVNLSVTMTLTSTVLSLGMIPLLLLIMKPAITDSDIEIPFDSIAITLVMLMVPLGIGLFLGWWEKTKKLAEWIKKISGALGVVLIIANLVMAFIMYPNAIKTTV